MSDDAKARDKGLAIQILGREYRVACPEGEEKQLQASVEYLNRRMKELRDTGKVTGNDRIATMAALNIAQLKKHAILLANGFITMDSLVAMGAHLAAGAKAAEKVKLK